MLVELQRVNEAVEVQAELAAELLQWAVLMAAAGGRLQRAARSVLSGPAQLVASHQRIQETCNAKLFWNLERH